jgi:hypothetical protein
MGALEHEEEGLRVTGSWRATRLIPDRRDAVCLPPPAGGQTRAGATRQASSRLASFSDSGVGTRSPASASP